MACSGHKHWMHSNDMFCKIFLMEEYRTIDCKVNRVIVNSIYYKIII